MPDLPTPDPDTRAVAPAGTTTSSTRRRLTIAVAVAGALGIGGAAAGSQLVSASAPVGDTPVPEADTPDRADSDDGPVVDIHLDDADLDWDELDEAFEPYDSCLAEQLPEMFGEDAITFEGDVLEGQEFEAQEFDIEELDDIDLSDSISVFTAGEDGEGEWTVLDLGDEDSSITITKTGGAVEIITDGDVEEFDIDGIEAELDFDDEFDIDPELEAQWEAEMERFDAAHQECADLMPDLGEFDDVVFIDSVLDGDGLDDPATIEAEEIED